MDGRYGGSPGNLSEWWGQAGQVEGPGAAVTADELPAVPAHRTLVLVLLAQGETAASGRCGMGLRPPLGPRTAPLLAAACSWVPPRPLLSLRWKVSPYTSWSIPLGKSRLSESPVSHGHLCFGGPLAARPPPCCPLLVGQQTGRAGDAPVGPGHLLSPPPKASLCPCLHGAHHGLLDTTSSRSPWAVRLDAHTAVSMLVVTVPLDPPARSRPGYRWLLGAWPSTAPGTVLPH